MAAMRFRIWHLLAAMVFVALWVPLSKWLLVLEAKDHPSIPQTTFDVIGFYLGSAAMAGVPVVLIAWIVVAVSRKRKREHAQGRQRPID